MDPRFLTAEKSPQKTQLHVNCVVLWDCGYPTTLSGESLSICHRPTLRDPGTLQDSIENLGTSYSLTLRDQGTLQDSIENMGICYRLTLWNPGIPQDSPEKTRVHVTVLRFGIRVPYNTAEKTWVQVTVLRSRIRVSHKTVQRKLGYMLPFYASESAYPTRQSTENLGTCYRSTLRNPGTLQDSPQKTWVRVTVLCFGLRVPYKT